MITALTNMLLDYSLLIIIILILIVFFLDGWKDGIFWLIFGAVTVIIVSLSYYFILLFFPNYGKWIFAGVITFLGLILESTNKRKP